MPHSLPVTAEPSFLRRLRSPLVAAAGVGLAVAALHLRDPHENGSWGLCPFHFLTGWDCPGCGGLRAVNDLSHGRLEAAWNSNALFITLIPLLVVGWVGWMVVSARGRTPAFVPRVRQLSLVLLPLVGVAFAVVRNTPWGQTYGAS